MRIKPKNWDQFQHYKDRSPPWIKLHRDLLNDRAFLCLPTASRALAPLLWLLASEKNDGVLDASKEELMFRLRIQEKEYEDGLKPLIDNGFFVVASKALASRKRSAIPEERRVEREREKRTPLPPLGVATVQQFPPGFEKFWQAYPRKTAKPQAVKAFARLKPDEALLNTLLAKLAVHLQSDQWVRDEGRFIPHPSTWLNQRRWEDEPTSVAKPAHDVFAGAL